MGEQTPPPPGLLSSSVPGTQLPCLHALMFVPHAYFKGLASDAMALRDGTFVIRAK